MREAVEPCPHREPRRLVSGTAASSSASPLSSSAPVAPAALLLQRLPSSSSSSSLWPLGGPQGGLGGGPYVDKMLLNERASRAVKVSSDEEE